jgi:hypothetical protein
MRRRWLAWSVLIFQTLWLNVIVPGHTRGIVLLPNAAAPSVAASGTCPFCGAETRTSSDATSKGSKPNSPQDSTRFCAICFFAAHLTVPPAVDLSLPPLAFRHAAYREIARDVVSLCVVLPFDGRGPPIV